MRLDNLSVLRAQAETDLAIHGFFHADGPADADGDAGEPGLGPVLSWQAGVFRSNCMDCLDRMPPPSPHPPLGTLRYCGVELLRYSR